MQIKLKLRTYVVGHKFLAHRSGYDGRPCKTLLFAGFVTSQNFVAYFIQCGRILTGPKNLERRSLCPVQIKLRASTVENMTCLFLSQVITPNFMFCVKRCGFEAVARSWLCRNTSFPHMGYHAQPSHSRSSGIGVQYMGRPKQIWESWSPPLGMLEGAADPYNMPHPTRLNMPNLTRCWSNGTILSAKIRRKHWAHRVPPFKIIQGHRVTFDDTNRSDTYDFLLMIQSNYGPIVQRFRYNRRFQF